MKYLFTAILGLVLLVSGCATSNQTPIGEAGPDGTVAYQVPVDASEPGVQIQVNGETVGTTPMVLKIFGDRDGSFHNFGSYEFFVRAIPRGGRPAMTKVYKTGALMAQEDKIPQKIFFDFGPNPEKQQ